MRARRALNLAVDRDKFVKEGFGGYAYAMWNSDTYAYGDDTDPLYVSVPFYIVLRQGRASVMSGGTSEHHGRVSSNHSRPATECSTQDDGGERAQQTA